MKKPISLRGDFSLPGDKSITHRAVMFGSIAEGTTEIKTTVLGRDNFATIRIMRQMGVEIDGEITESLKIIAQEEGLGDFKICSGKESKISVKGKGLNSLQAPTSELNCGNSGTTARLLTGLLAGRKFKASLNGDHSLVKRPFKRVIEPLSEMGAKFSKELLPFTIEGGDLVGIDYLSKQASAQVKSAIVLAGLSASGDVSITEPRLSRDHTERMLTAMGCVIKTEKLIDGSYKISLPDVPSRGILKAQKIDIPGDISAAAFFMVAGSIFLDSEIILRNVGFNSTRIGIYHILKKMGANIEIFNQHEMCGEEVVDLKISTAKLKAVEIGEEDVVLAIDEIPIITVAAAFARGVTKIRGARELRVKESDRLKMSAAILTSFGIKTVEYDDGIDVYGDPDLLTQSVALKDDANWKISGDHRVAMCGAILELQLTADFTFEDKSAVETSFPEFDQILQGLILR